jgi:hypothetical protein
MKLKLRELVLTMFAGPALGLISFIFLLYYGPFEAKSSEAIVFSLATTIFFLVLSHMFFIWQQYNKHIEQSEKIENVIKNSIHITPIGSVIKALEYVNSRLPSIIEVQNTSFTTPNSKDNANDKFYHTEIFEKIQLDIPKYTAKGLLWKDIGDNKDAIAKMEERSNQANKINKNHKYRFKKIKNKIPKMNFIIIKYINGDEEILFNWDLRNKSGEPTVYVSRDESIINMFSILYFDLWDFAEIPHDNIDTR